MEGNKVKSMIKNVFKQIYLDTRFKEEKRELEMQNLAILGEETIDDSVILDEGNDSN